MDLGLVLEAMDLAGFEVYSVQEIKQKKKKIKIFYCSNRFKYRFSVSISISVIIYQDMYQMVNVEGFVLFYP